MDNLVSRCQDKLQYFRLKELKDVLSRLGLAKQGKKQVLVERILAMLSDDKESRSHGWGSKHVIGRDEVAKIIDDTYRKMNGNEASELASAIQHGPRLTGIPQPNVIKEPPKPEPKICCPCGSSMKSEDIIQCFDTKCGVWQHQGCVIIPENPVEGLKPEIPSQFYCDICRVNRGDPFCVTLTQPVLPTKLSTSPITVDGANPSQTVEKTFILTRTDRDMLQKTGHELQVWCILLNDKVPFRMHWPQNTDLRINGISVKVTNRPNTQVLGLNGRDDGPGIAACSREGTNRISLQAYDSRSFVLGVRIMRRQTVEQVLNRIPGQSEGESFEEALSRVRRCIGVGAPLQNGEDSDSDLEVVAESNTVNLRCPMSGSRIKVAGRFKPCIHMGCFDLDTFVELNQRARKWQCPICLKNYSLENIIIDPYFNIVTNFMESYPEDVTEVEVKPDCSWRPKLEGKARLLEKWHLPDGSTVIANGDLSQEKELPNKVKLEAEGISGGHTSLKIGIKRNRDGYWELSGANHNNMSGKHGKQSLKVAPASSSATATNRDDEDPSVNQEGSENPDFSQNNDFVFDSPFRGFDHPSDTAVRHVDSEFPNEPEVIVVSDSDEENVDETNIGSSTRSAFPCPDPYGQEIAVPLNFSDALHDTVQIDCNGVPYSNPLLRPFGEALPPQNSINSSLGFLDASSGDFSESAMHSWLSPPQNSTVRTSVVRPTPVNWYGSHGIGAREQQGNTTVESTIPDYGQSLDCPFPSINMEGNRHFDNSTQVETADLCLQFLLPPQPARASSQINYTNGAMMSDDVQTDWISLSLGSGNVCKTNKEVAQAQAQSQAQAQVQAQVQAQAQAACDTQQSAPEGDRLDLATASVLLNMSDNRTEVASGDNQGSESPLSHCQRPRSGRSRNRPRFYFSIESDSD